MAPNDPKLEPLLSIAERDELGHLDYFLKRLADLRDRGLITPDAYATAASEGDNRRATINRAGEYAACIGKARGLAVSRPKEAIAWAEHAIEINRERIDAWRMIVDLHWIHEEDEAAIAWCPRGAELFPALNSELERMRSESPPRAARRLERARKIELERETSRRLHDVRKALEEHRFADAGAVCDEILAERPDQIEALANKAFALRQAGQSDAALEVYGQLVRLEPQNPVWPRWLQELRTQRLPSARAAKNAGQSEPESVLPADPVYIPAERSWSGFTSEFVKEHWQKLILSLAVLLIVVSSTVGAHILLGDLLWSPEGKCTLALVGTLLLAALGTGLERWGAERAGRMMLITTLIVVPIHFMLAGELRLLLQPPSTRLVFLAVVALVLVALVRWASGRLAEPRGAWLMTASLLLISLGSAATTRGSSIAWALQFACFQLAPLVFLATVFAMGKRQWGSSEREHREYVYTMFGVLGFALFSCMFRAGAYVLRLDLALYAMPAMLGAISVVLASRRLAPFEPDKKRLALYELGGYVLSGLAFALAYSSPYGTSALFSTNIVAVATLGIGLYSVALGTIAIRRFCTSRWELTSPASWALVLRCRSLSCAGGRRRAGAWIFRATSTTIPGNRHRSHQPGACRTRGVVRQGMEGPTACSSLPLPGVAAVAGGLRLEHIRTAGGLHLPVGVRDPVLAWSVDLRRPASDLSRRCRSHRRVLFRLDAGSRNDHLRASVARGRDRMRVLGDQRATLPAAGWQRVPNAMVSWFGGSPRAWVRRRHVGSDGAEHRDCDRQHHLRAALGPRRSGQPREAKPGLGLRRVCQLVRAHGVRDRHRRAGTPRARSRAGSARPGRCLAGAGFLGSNPANQAALGIAGRHARRSGVGGRVSHRGRPVCHRGDRRGGLARLLDVDHTWLSGLIFLLGSVALIWSTRIVRRKSVTYLGLGHLTVAYSTSPGGRPGPVTPTSGWPGLGLLRPCWHWRSGLLPLRYVVPDSRTSTRGPAWKSRSC